jgi:hypothetical protein
VVIPPESPKSIGAESEVVSLIRRQYSRFVKEKCSNGAHYFIKFKDKSMSWSERALILEAV